MPKRIDFDAEIKTASALAVTPYEKSMVRLTYMLLGYVRTLEWEVDILARGLTDKERAIWNKVTKAPG